MKKYKFMIFFLVIFLFEFNGYVSALEVDENDTNCTFVSESHLNKLASSVSAAYEFKYENDNSVSFNISVYNITEDIYVTISNDFNDTIETVYYLDTRNGTYTFNEKNTTDIFKYTIVIRSNKYGCTNDLRKIYVVKPKSNKFYGRDICKYQEVHDYFYCQEWISQDFNLTDEEIASKIENKRQSVKATAKTKCVSCEIEEENKRRIAEFEQLKKNVIMGILIAIVINVLVIGVLVYRIRKADVW